MRPIKFRGKSSRTGEWFYGNLYAEDAYGRTHITIPTKACLCIDPSTVGQFTGLHDKNGNEIYEGDILQMDAWRPELAVVTFDDGAFCLKQEDIHYMNDIHYVHHAGRPQATIIGNIHDNPELLKGGEK